MGNFYFLWSNDIQEKKKKVKKALIYFDSRMMLEHLKPLSSSLPLL